MEAGSAMRSLLALALSSALLGQAPPKPQQRDLVHEPLPPPRAALDQPVAVPRGYAVVIGVSDYQHLAAEDDLPFAERDAEKLYSALIHKEGGNMEWANVKKLMGKDATLANIRAAIEEWLPSVATEPDRVVVYFVGHGLVDPQGRGYLAPYDVQPGAIAESAYPMARLSEVLGKQVKARWKVLLTDACHSGKISPDSSVERINESFRNLPRSFLTLNSSREAERSYEDKELAGGSGVFTYFLVQGWLGQADIDPNDGIVTADELIDYVRREVRSYTRSRGVTQTPTDHGDFPNDLILGFSPTRRQQLVASTAQLANGTLIVEANLDEVEIYVGDQRYGVASPGKPLHIPGLASGQHTVRGVRMGYEPAILEVNLVPGSTQTVSLRLLYQRTVKPQARANLKEAQEIWDRSRGNAPQLKRAASLLDAALKDEPRFSEAALLQCRVQNALGDNARALKLCRQAVNADQDYVEARVMMSILLLQTGDAPEAVRQLQQASAQSPSDSYIHSVLAEALIQVERYEDAEKSASRALELDNASAQAHLLRADARLYLDLYDEAIDDYQRSLALSDFNSGALRRIAFYAVGHGVTKNRSGRRALHRTQKAAAYYGLCSCEFHRENFLRAIPWCERSLAEDPSDVEAHILLGQANLSLFNRDNRKDQLLGAQRHLEQALRLQPAHQNAPQLKSQLVMIREYLPVVR